MSHEDTPEHGTQTQRTPQPFGEDGPPPGQARAAPEENSPPANERAKFIRELDGIIGSYRDQTLRKSQAVGAVVRIIENYGGVTEIEKESTLGLYLEEICSIEVGDSNSTKSDKSSNVDSEDESVDRQSKHSRDEDPTDDDVDKSPRKRRANEMLRISSLSQDYYTPLPRDLLTCAAALTFSFVFDSLCTISDSPRLVSFRLLYA